MRESSTYQAILEEGMAEGRDRGRAEGRAQEARTLLLRLGTRRFGEPAPDISAAVRSISDVDRLEALTERVLDASDWTDLLGPTA